MVSLRNLRSRCPCQDGQGPRYGRPKRTKRQVVARRGGQVPPSVRTVTDLPGLGLRIVAGPDGRVSPVRWVAVSELEDPTAFLEGGELLLSTGMRLPAEDSTALAEYVGRLVSAGVAALGLGVGLTHSRVPPALAAAADAAGLPLIEVPAGTAFIAISKAVSALLGAEEHEGITRAFEAQRDLT